MKKIIVEDFNKTTAFIYTDTLYEIRYTEAEVLKHKGSLITQEDYSYTAGYRGYSVSEPSWSDVTKDDIEEFANEHRERWIEVK